MDRLGVSPQNRQVLEQWDRHLQQQEEALQLAEAAVAKTDRTLWFMGSTKPSHDAMTGKSTLSTVCHHEGAGIEGEFLVFGDAAHAVSSHPGH